MPKKTDRSKPQATFAVVQQSYEDPEAGDVPKPVLVPVNKARRPVKKPAVRFMEDMEGPQGDQHRLNMRMADDTVEERIFDDEVEEEFESDWIKQMMTGDGIIDSDEEYDEFEDDDQYPQHAERRAQERMFDRAMQDFDFDEDIEEEDPRVQGPLQVEDYAPALEEFVQEGAGVSYAHPDEAYQRKGLMHKMSALARQHRVFDSNAEGHFITTLDPDKGRRIAVNFADDARALKAITLESIRRGEIDTTDVLYRDDKDVKLVPVQVPNRDRADCETALSTYTNVYNNPTVIAAQTKKVKLSVNAARKAKEEASAARQAASKHSDPHAKTGGAGKRSPQAGPTKIGAGGVVPAMAAAASEDSDDDGAGAGPSGAADEQALWDELPDEALPTMMDLSERPKDESKEEKKLRRALVKEMQRERRAEKKNTKTAYKQAGAAHAATAERQKIDKKTIPIPSSGASEVAAKALLQGSITPPTFD
eukprot:CAMPEP_0174831380 /NCGR_PEP_ID=MMETSP1114-20130205/3058_1 /TAXON_ID=312471 /ORGANISM="Neobodo designis, Strain CCAP 1951/1" /LENGTH=477 /DNA_ID=CAMNT_0016065203 /DNA_START=48 /DNA_END=1482 /DNA_ORIENTATION=+